MKDLLWCSVRQGIGLAFISAAKVVRLTGYSTPPRRQRMMRQLSQHALEGLRLNAESKRLFGHPVTSLKADGPMRLHSSCPFPPDPSFTCTDGVEIQLFLNFVNSPDHVSASLEAFRPPFHGLRWRPNRRISNTKPSSTASLVSFP